MSITRKQLAEIIEGYDGEISALQTSKRATYEDYRSDLAKAGYDKDAVKAEIEAFKLALRRKAAVAKSSDDAVLAKDELVDEIFTEITAVRAPRATRVETIEEFDADTGEFIEIVRPEQVGHITRLTPEPDAALRPQTGEVETLVANSGVGNPDLHTEPVIVPPPAITEAGDGDSTDSSPGAVPGATNVTLFRTHNPETHFLNSTGLMRLHGCQKPDSCGSEQARLKLCFSCSTQHEGPAFVGGAA